MASRRKRKTEEEENEIIDSMMEPVLNDILKNKKIELKFKNQKQKLLADLIEQKEIIFSAGPAGCGKTYVACAEALKIFKADPKFKRIYIIKSVTTIEGEEIGYLKGTLEEKMEPFMFSFINNFEKVVGPILIKELRERGGIQVMPIAYLRGVNLDNAIIIIDEIQNLTKKHIKTILTRLGSDSKMILMGDMDQMDKTIKGEPGFTWSLRIFKENPRIGIHEFTIEDSVRNPLVTEMLSIMKADEETN